MASSINILYSFNKQTIRRWCQSATANAFDWRQYLLILFEDLTSFKTKTKELHAEHSAECDYS